MFWFCSGRTTNSLSLGILSKYCLTVTGTVVQKFVDNQFQKTIIVSINWSLPRVFKYFAFVFASHKLSELCVTHGHGFWKNYLPGSHKLFPFYHHSFHANLWECLSSVQKYHGISAGLYIELFTCIGAHNKTKLRHIVDTCTVDMLTLHFIERLAKLC